MRKMSDKIKAMFEGLGIEMDQVIRLAGRLSENGIVIFTLKLTDAETYQAINDLAGEVEKRAATAGLFRLSLTHLTYNRHEFTLLLAHSE